MKEKICCKIINQIPLLKYSNLGIIVRVQATRYDSKDQVNLIFDIFVNEIVPTKSTFFSNINVSNNGNFVLLTSLSCCILSEIPWNYLDSSKTVSTRNINLNEIKNKNEKMIEKKFSHIYGLFEDDLDISESNISNYKDNFIQKETIEIPLLKGICILNLLNNLKQNDFKTGDDSYIVKSNWYHLDDYTLFLLINVLDKNKSPYYNNTKILVLDLSQIINEKQVEFDNSSLKETFISNIFEFPESIDKPVDFAYGRGPDLWNILSLFVLFENNVIKTICPVITNRMKLPYFAYEVLYSSLLEQEFFLQAKNQHNIQNSYDENLYNILNIIMSDLRNPVDESGNIIDDYLYIDISKDSYNLISKLFKPTPIELKINWDKHKNNLKVKSVKLSFITNYPISVFIILNSDKIIGLFISSFLSSPHFQINEEFTDLDDHFQLNCLQDFEIPSEWLKMNENLNNIRFYDSVFDQNYFVDQNLFAIGISINNTFAVIHIDWLHYLFSLYSFENNDNQNMKKTPVSDQIESIRKYLISNSKLLIDKLISLENNIDFNECSLIFISEYDKEIEDISKNGNLDNKQNLNKINLKKINIEFIYPVILNNESKEELILINSNYDELPVLSSKNLFSTLSIKKNYFVDNKTFKEIELNDKNNQFELEIENQVTSLNKLSEIAISNCFKEFFHKLKLIKEEFEPIEKKDNIIDYHLKILKLLNDYNRDIIFKLKVSSRPLVNLINNIKPRLSLLENFQEEIKVESNKIIQKEQEINGKIRDTITTNNILQERMIKIKHLLIQELNFYRIQYDQDVIIPELLLMLSNIQLELCWSIINVSNFNDTSIENSYDINNVSNKLEVYINHNKQVLERFQSLRTKIIELNKLIEH